MISLGRVDSGMFFIEVDVSMDDAGCI